MLNNNITEVENPTEIDFLYFIPFRGQSESQLISLSEFGMIKYCIF